MTIFLQNSQNNQKTNDKKQFIKLNIHQKT